MTTVTTNEVPRRGADSGREYVAAGGDDRFPPGGDWVETIGGRRVNFDGPVALDQIDIRDIAAALSMQCRYNGHLQNYYSVAEHCCHAHDLAPSGQGLRLPALMHDAAEAYIGDIVRPLKRLLPAVKVIEARLEAAIARVFGLPDPMPPEIAIIDGRLLASEALEFYGADRVASWGKLPRPYRGWEPRYWQPARARDEFLDRFLATFGARRP